MRDDSPLQETDKLPPTSAQDAHRLPNKGRWCLGDCNELWMLSQAAHPGLWVLFVCSICGDPTCTDSMGHSCCKGILRKACAHPTSYHDVKNQGDVRANASLRREHTEDDRVDPATLCRRDDPFSWLCQGWQGQIWDGAPPP